MEAMIAARVLQGIGGGLLVPVGMAVLFRAFPEEERATASAIFSIPAAVAPALGPFLGGILIDTIGWRWIFLINVPIGLVGLALAILWLDSIVSRMPVPWMLRGWPWAPLGSWR
jgi:MFS family permease